MCCGASAGSEALAPVEPNSRKLSPKRDAEGDEDAEKDEEQTPDVEHDDDEDEDDHEYDDEDEDEAEDDLEDELDEDDDLADDDGDEDVLDDEDEDDADDDDDNDDDDDDDDDDDGDELDGDDDGDELDGDDDDEDDDDDDDDRDAAAEDDEDASEEADSDDKPVDEDTDRDAEPKPDSDPEPEPEPASSLPSDPEPPAPSPQSSRPPRARRPPSAADPAKWKVDSVTTGGSYSFKSIGEREEVQGAVEEGVARLSAEPNKYLALTYQTNMRDGTWPDSQQRYTLIHRAGTAGYEPNQDGEGFTVMMNRYEALPALDGEVPSDGHFDDGPASTFRGAPLYGDGNPPARPGRGDGVLDVPGLKIIGDADPSDIKQGTVGDCWLLSAISAMAEFDGAIHALFANTPGLDEMPRDGPNEYVVTLYDLETWEPRDVRVDERLAMNPNRPKNLLGASPSEDGELWVPYLEKAVAAHCGGWDEIEGGNCPHAWAMLTGCKQQYTITKESDGRYAIWGMQHPTSGYWEEQTNSSVRNRGRSMWPMRWPDEGGGGDVDERFDRDQLFAKMAAWDEAHFIVGCSTEGNDDSTKTDGIVDGHAYTVLRSVVNVAGSGHDLVQVRNPWGSGEFETGMWDDDGPGWDEFPDVKAELKPVARDDGVFWMSKEEFFKYFTRVYVCAKRMA